MSLPNNRAPIPYQAPCCPVSEARRCQTTPAGSKGPCSRFLDMDSHILSILVSNLCVKICEQWSYVVFYQRLISLSLWHMNCPELLKRCCKIGLNFRELSSTYGSLARFTPIGFVKG